MTTLTPGGQRLRTVLIENDILVEHEGEIETGTMVGVADLNAAWADLGLSLPALPFGLDAPPAGGDGGLREALKPFAASAQSLTESPPTGLANGNLYAACKNKGEGTGWRFLPIHALVSDLHRASAALARPNPREQAAAGVGEKPAKELARELRDIIMADVRAASGSNAFPGEPVGVSARHLSIILTARLGCHFAALTQPNQTPEAAAPSGSVGEDKAQCERCQGNGEIVTDWDRYLHSHDGDVGDEAVAECPDCYGYGHADPSSAAQQPAPQAPVADAAGDFRAEIARIADDYHPDRDQEAPLALSEMREALQAALEQSAALTPPQAARPGDGVKRADEAMRQLWKEWLAFYNAHFRTVTGISAADQMAFYEIAQPILRGLVAPAPVQADAAEGRS